MYKKLLVPVDGSVPSVLGLKEAIKLAKSQRSGPDRRAGNGMPS